jgi:hypothetical protein
LSTLWQLTAYKKFCGCFTVQGAVFQKSPLVAEGIGFNLTSHGYKGFISPGKKIIYRRKIFFSGRKEIISGRKEFIKCGLEKVDPGPGGIYPWRLIFPF